MLSISKNIRPRVCLCVCLLSVRSEVFRDWESLGKSNGKKWFQIGKVLLIKDAKSPHKKKCFWVNFALLSRIVLLLVFLTPFNGLFAPISRGPMWKLVRVSKSIGKSNGKKWSQICKLLLIKGVKSPRQKKNFNGFFTPFKRLFAPTSWSPIFLVFQNPWGKVMERSCLIFKNFCTKIV